MRALKITGFVIGGLLALVIIVLLAVWAFVNPNDYKGRIAQAVKTSTGRELSLPGDIKLSVFPWIALELGPASLASPPGFGNAPFAAVRHAVLRVKLLPLLRRQLQIGRIRVDGLDLQLKKNAAGHGNWEDFGQNDTAAPSTGGGGGEALQDLAGLVITDSRIRYQDLAIEHLNLDVGHVTAAAAVPIHFGLDLITGHDSRPIRMDGELVATLDWGAKRYRLSALQLKGSYAPRTGAAPVPFQLSVPDLNLDLAAQSLSAPKFSLELAAARIVGKIDGRGIVDAPIMTGSFQLAPLALRDYMIQLGVTPPVTRDARAFSRLTGSGNFFSGGNALRATELNMQMDDSTLRGSAEITNLDTLASSFDLALDRIDIDRYRSPASAASAPPKPLAKPGERPTTSLKSLTTSGTMRIGAATIAGMKLTNLSIGVHAKDGIARIAPATAQLYGGQYSGAIVLDERTRESVLNVDQSMTSVDMARLLEDFAKTKRLSGRGNLNLHLSAHGQTGDELIKTSAGHIEANLANGALEGIDLWYEIKRAQSLLRQQALPAGTSTGRTAFDTFKASAEVSNGIATTKDLNIASALLHVTGQGLTNLVSKAINYDITATVLKSAPGAAQDVGGLTLAEIPVKVGGTIDHPTVRPDLEALARKRVQQELGKHKDELRQKLQKQLQNLIKQ